MEDRAFWYVNSSEYQNIGVQINAGWADRQKLLKKWLAYRSDAADERKLPCGTKVIASLKALGDNLSDKDIPCPCGHPHHWLVRYG